MLRRQRAQLLERKFDQIAETPARGGPSIASMRHHRAFLRMEAGSGIEPLYEDLQSSA